MSSDVADPITAEFNQLAALFSAGRHVEMENRARRLVEQHPDAGLAWKALGISLKVQNKDALAALQNATKYLPADAEAHFNLGATLTDLGQADAAVASYRRALEIAPDYPAALNNLGNVLLGLRQIDESTACFRRLLKIMPGLAEAHGNLGNALRALGQFDEAAQSYRRALQIRPVFAEAHSNLGIALTELGQLEAAATSCRRALAINPNYAAAHRNLGFALNGLGQLDAAVASYQRALAIKPDFAEAHIALGNSLMGLGDADAAVASFRRVLEIEPGNGYATHMIATITGSNADHATDGYVSQLFDGYAGKFDNHLVGDLGYRVPKQIVELICQAMVSTSGKWDVLDLGCGTGLVGAAIAPRTQRLVGVDLSQKMLDKARSRRVYTRLENCALIELVAGEPPGSYDIISAAEVLNYVGRLDSLFPEVKRILRPGGMFAFTVEALDPLPAIQAADGKLRESYLLPTGRFAHSSAYVQRLALEHGFKTHHFESTSLRLHAAEPLQGWMVLLTRTGEESD